jgi:hypothetical protein
MSEQYAQGVQSITATETSVAHISEESKQIPVAMGELTPTEGAHIMALVETYRRTLETTELEARVAALEGGGA